jgi:hypothetical protein
MHHKYEDEQMLFVKNVPQESAAHVAGLFTKYKPLETKNLYPFARITTLMIALPSSGVTENALNELNNWRINNIVITVERYNSKQSTVARREARKKRKDLPHGRANGKHHNGDYNGYDGGKEVRTRKDEAKPSKLVAMPPREALPLRTKRVSESGGINWAGIAGGTQSAKLPSSPSSSPALALAPARGDTPQQQLRQVEAFPKLKQKTAPEDTARRPELSATDARPSTVPTRQPSPLTAPTSATPSTGSRRLDPYSPSTDSPSCNHFHTATEGRTPPRATQTSSSESSRVDEDSSQQTQALDLMHMRRGTLGMPSDTTTFIKSKHSVDCVFCRMREESQKRGSAHSDN